jgi:hypothetical protein
MFNNINNNLNREEMKKLIKDVKRGLRILMEYNGNQLINGKFVL